MTIKYFLVYWLISGDGKAKSVIELFNFLLSIVTYEFIYIVFWGLCILN